MPIASAITTIATALPAMMRLVGPRCSLLVTARSLPLPRTPAANPGLRHDLCGRTR